jgi:hypothetical protein
MRQRSRSLTHRATLGVRDGSYLAIKSLSHLNKNGQHSGRGFSNQEVMRETRISKREGDIFAGLSLKILRLRSGFRLAAQTPPAQLNMYYFALESMGEIG